MTTNRVKKRSKVGDGILQAVYICLGLTIAFPIIYAVLISFMEPSQVLAGGVNLIPKKWTLENYKTALTSAPLMRFMLNSLILALGASVVRLAVSSLAAFAFAFLDFPCKNVIFMVMLATIMIPADIVLVANYRTVSSLGLINTYLGMMIVFFVSAMNIFQLRQSFLTFAVSLKEAAHIDGCSIFPYDSSSNKCIYLTYCIYYSIYWNLEYLFVAIVSNEPDGYENSSGWYYNAELFGRHGLWSNYGSINNCYDPYAFPVLCIPEENCSWNDVRRRERINTRQEV